jgi:protein gp37
MGDRSSIEWTDATWNPTRGCSRVSEGCRNCYAERVAARFSGKGQPYEGLAVQRRGSKWTGEVRLVPGRLADPLRWRKPKRVFVNSMSDLFHEKLSNEEIGAVFGVMAACPQHTFQVLTKRPERMREWFAGGGDDFDIASAACARLARVGFDTGCGSAFDPDEWPLPNVWLGVSAEDQATADARIPLLLETPASVRFVSYEPALGPVNLGDHLILDHWASAPCRIDWVIAGSESGPGARPAELDWFRSVRDQCAAAAVPFFFKQWVGWRDGGEPLDNPRGTGRGKVSLPVLDGSQHVEWPQ